MKKSCETMRVQTIFVSIFYIYVSWNKYKKRIIVEVENIYATYIFFLTTKFPYGEISLRRNFLTANFLTAKFPTAKFHSAGGSTVGFFGLWVEWWCVGHLHEGLSTKLEDAKILFPSFLQTISFHIFSALICIFFSKPIENFHETSNYTYFH